MTEPFNPYHEPIPQGYGICDQTDEPEEKHCPKCGELVEECQCWYYDKLEREELNKTL